MTGQSARATDPDFPALSMVSLWFRASLLLARVSQAQACPSVISRRSLMQSSSLVCVRLSTSVAAASSMYLNAPIAMQSAGEEKKPQSRTHLAIGIVCSDLAGAVNLIRW